MRLKTENGASGKCWKLLENDRIELENMIISFKVRIDQLETTGEKFKIELKKKQAQLEIFEKQNNALIQKIEKLTKENKANESEFSLCKSRIDRLERLQKSEFFVYRINSKYLKVIRQ